MQKLLSTQVSFGGYLVFQPKFYDRALFGVNVDDVALNSSQVIRCVLLANSHSRNSFHGRRKCGMMERSIVAGVRTWEIMGSYLISEFFILMPQTLVTLAVVLFVCGIKIVGSIYLALGLLLLIGCCGASLGFLFGSFCREKIEVPILGLAFFIPTSFFVEYIGLLKGCQNFFSVSQSSFPAATTNPGSPRKFDAVPKLINITVLSYSVVIPPDSVISVKNLVLEADKAKQNPVEKSSDNIRRVSYLSDKTLGWKRYLGVLYTLFSTCMLSLSANLLKMLSHINPLTLGTYGFLVAALLSIPFIWYTLKIEKKSVMKNILPLREKKKSYFSCGHKNHFGFICNHNQLFCCLCLGEKCGVVPIVFAIIAFCGILVMTRPPILTGAERYDENTLIGVSIAFGCLLLATIIILTLRFLKNVHHGVLNLSLYAWAFLTTLSFAVVYDQWKPPENVGDILTTFGSWNYAVSWKYVSFPCASSGGGRCCFAGTNQSCARRHWSGCGDLAKIFGFVATRKQLEEEAGLFIVI
ncbi:ABC transporter G family member 20, partial [Orchesella cincta]